ncbi:DUF2178 domain-containing protein [Halorarum halobium]|uniref:DUF2178 domain-containing protein n=1 Tax=Halorarum halobium TaxID=3075121 RepID=UPI0028AC4A3F|nr:DUF2178 domain-containing protein [Halobaculum sp. XH14]
MTTTRPIQSGRRYRRIIYALIGVGIASLLGGMFLDYSLAGLVVYAVTAVGALALTLFLQFGSEIELQDEREREIGRRASDVTFQLFGYLGLVVFVAMFLLEATSQYTMTARAETLLYAYAVICLTWGGIYVVFRYRS